MKAFSTCTGVASGQQSFTVNGSNLTANIAITAPTGFEVSTTSGSGFGTSVTLTQSSGSVSPHLCTYGFNRYWFAFGQCDLYYLTMTNGRTALRETSNKKRKVKKVQRQGSIGHPTPARND